MFVMEIPLWLVISIEYTDTVYGTDDVDKGQSFGDIEFNSQAR